MNQLSTAATLGVATKTTADAIRPFRVNFPKAALEDLRRRVAATKWPGRETVTDETQGVQACLAQFRTTSTRPPAPSGLSADERQAYDRLVFFFTKGLAYALEMGNRPQTLYGIEDSPIGLAAWILDHDERSYLLMARVFDGGSEGLTRDDILDNITLYWLTNTAISSARLYWENKFTFFTPKNVSIPVAVSAFPDDLYYAPRSWAERAYPKLIHFNRLDKGGHFAAWEQPKAFSEELRVAFRSLRSQSSD